MSARKPSKRLIAKYTIHCLDGQDADIQIKAKSGLRTNTLKPSGIITGHLLRRMEQD
jgi:hypothetical protein